MRNQEKIFVIGHKNPDTDSICSAIAYADIKNRTSQKVKYIQNRDRIIWAVLCGIFALTLFVGWLYYQAYRSKTKRILAEKENANLKLEQDNLRKEKEKVDFGPPFLVAIKSKKNKKLSQLLKSHLSNLPMFHLRKKLFTLKRTFN